MSLFDAVLDISSVIHLLDRLEMALGAGELNTVLRTAMDETLTFLQSQVPPYPPKPPPGTVSRGWTAKQRRWFFWALKQGLIRGTYRRTLTLGRTLTTETGDAIRTVGGAGLAIYGKWGTRLAYAKWVIDEVNQAYMHRGRWWTLQSVLRANWAEAQDVFIRSVRRQLAALSLT